MVSACALQVSALVLTGRDTPDGTLFLAGRSDAADANATPHEGRLWAVSAHTGERLTQITLPAPPVFDTLVAVDQSLYLAMQDGTLMCLRDQQPEATSRRD